MFHIRNDVKTTNMLYTGSHISFPILWGKHLKRMSTHLYYIIYNEINLSHSDIQKHVSDKNQYYKYFVYRLTQTFCDPKRENV